MSANFRYLSEAAIEDKASLLTEAAAVTRIVHVKAACHNCSSNASSDRCSARAAAKYQARSIGCPARRRRRWGI